MRRTLLLALLLLCIQTTGICAQSVVMPVGFADLEGGASNVFPFSCAPALTEMRYMQVYDGQQVGTGYITELRFRQDGTNGMDFPPTNLPSPVIVLSSTASPVDGLDPFFGANFGSDFKLVWTSPSSVSLASRTDFCVRDCSD